MMAAKAEGGGLRARVFKCPNCGAQERSFLAYRPTCVFCPERVKMEVV